MSLTTLAQPVWQVGDWTGNATDDFGVDWVVTTEDGWSARPAVRSTDTEREGADGDYLGISSYSARTITLTGVAVAPDPIAMALARERFLGTGALLNTDTLLIANERHMTRQCWVRPVDVWKAGDYPAGGGLAFDFQLVVKARDPRKYSADENELVMVLPHHDQNTGDVYLPSYTADYGLPTAGWPFPWPLPWRFGRAVGGIYTLFTTGNYPTLPLYEITGPVAQPVIVNTTSNATLTLNITLAAGETLLVDTAAEAVLLGGTSPRMSAVGPGSLFPALLPGANRLVYRAAGFTASTCTVRYRNSWI